MTDRFFVPEPIPAEQTQVVLHDQEAHHLARVLRAQVGQKVVLIDGSGWEFVGRVVHIARRRVVVQILQRRQVDRELPREVVFAVALPKHARQQPIVEALVQLGISRLVPLECLRSVARVDDKTLGRLQRWVQEATKQCGRTRLMKVAPAQSWSAVASDLNRSADRHRLGLFVHPGAEQSLWGLLQGQNPQQWESIWAAVGPEGGFSEQEYQLALQHGWQVVHLGPRTLRVETAVAVVAGTVSLWLQG